MSFLLEDDNSWQDKMESAIRTISNRNRPTNLQTINQNSLATGPSTRAGQDQRGTFSATPATYNIDVNGAFTVVSMGAIVDDPNNNTTINLKTMNGAVKNGTIVTLRGKLGKSFVIKAGGNFDVAADTTFVDSQFLWAIWYADKGEWILHASTVAGGGGGTLWSTITIDVNKDMGAHSLLHLSQIASDTVPTDYISLANGTGLTFHVQNTDQHIFNIAGTNFLVISSANGIQAFTLLDMGSNTIQNTAHVKPGSDLLYTLGDQTHRYNQLFVNVLKYSAGREIDLNAGGFSGILYSVNTNETHQFQVNAANYMEIDGIAGVVIQGTVPLTVGGVSSLNGNVFVGSSSANTLTVTASLASDLIPNNDAGRALGSGSKRFKSIDVQTVNITGAVTFIGTPSAQGWASDDYPFSDGGSNLGTVTGGNRRWNNLYMVGEIFAYTNTASTNKYAYMFSDPGTEFAFFGMNDATAEKRGVTIGINNGHYFDTVHDPGAGTQIANDYVRNFYTEMIVPAGFASNNFSLDECINESPFEFVLAGNTDTNLFNASDSFSGIIIIKNITNGTMAMFLTASGAMILMAQSGGLFTTTHNNVNTTNLYVSANQIMIQNKEGANRTYIMFALRVHNTNS